MNKSQCPSCGNQFNGKFCDACGEQKLDAEQRSLLVLVSHLVEELTSVDGKLFKTIKYFFIKPGFLCREFRRGARKPYLSPITLFFIFNLIYFFSAPLSDFNLSLKEQYLQPHAALIVPTIEAYLVDHQISEEELAEKYNKVSPTIAKSTVIISIPFLAFLVWLINIDRRYFAQDHFIFSLNIYSFILIWPTLLKLISNSLDWLLSVAIFSDHYFYWLQAGLLIYLWLSQKNFYETQWVITSLKTVLLIIAVFVSHFMYRFIQFWLTWSQIT
ncbi:DUF3667 domain-containing protein [Aliikangiella marina]|uniref:DUF3667 domain-containing protein n=1 Tax=Aliikangiella marina TaxID=1712262 RepID=A0A545T1A5_9GAMM|nr:DUF3667 domain-containing protein [Aliikangiella marina]TQV70992.1 DUF3667 domain-containing protein [Aliikangiella marina]